MMRSALVSLVLVLACCGGAESSDPPPEQPEASSSSSLSAAEPEALPRFDRPAPITESGQPTRAELFLMLAANADVPLSAGEFCDGVVGLDLDREPVLGDWIAYNLSVLEDPPITLPAGCEDDGETWLCTVEFQADSDGESPWSWGVRFAVNKSARRPVPDSLMCTGAG